MGCPWRFDFEKLQGRAGRLFHFVEVFLFIAIFPARAALAGYTADQLAQIPAVTEAKISPDGRRVVFVSDFNGSLEAWLAVVPEQKNPPLWPRQISQLREQVSHLEFSPDGKWIYFASDYGGNERRDLYRAPIDGGPVESLTATPASESEPVLSPDGRYLAFTADAQREWVFQLHVMDLKTREIKVLTNEDLSVILPVWSKDSRQIAVTKTNDDQKGETLVVDLIKGSIQRVSPPVAGAIIMAKDFSPDGRWILTLAQNPGGFMQLAVVSLTGEGVQWIGPDRWDTEKAFWHERGIYFSRNEQARSSLNFISKAQLDKFFKTGRAPKWETLLQPSGVIQDISISKNGRRLCVLKEDSTRPAEVWVGDVKTGPDRLVTETLPVSIDPNRLSPAQDFEYTSRDGVRVHALLFLPSHQDLGSPPPLIVHAHGGPDYQFRDEFHPLRQSLLQAGFAVVAPNFRGSTGYGQAFENFNNHDWGGGDLQDLIEAVGQISRRGQIDPARVGITGRSYGGYLTLLALAKTPQLWRAGVEAFGMADLVQDYELSKEAFGPWYETEMGTPETHPRLFWDRSAINFVDQIRAPLLIFQGANDPNVPKAESEAIVSTLRQRGSSVEYIEYPDEGHGFVKTSNRIDSDRRTVQFFIHHLGKPVQDPPPDWSAPARGESFVSVSENSDLKKIFPTDMKSIQEETLTHLKELIRLDTSNPPGNEIIAARYFENVLTQEGIESEILVASQTRASIVARLKGSGKKRPFLLFCHSDVVPADQKQWTVDPFSPTIKEGYLYGRGAADDKGMCAAELMTLIALKRRKVPLDRDVIFAAQADEENGDNDRHIYWLVKNHWDKLDAEYGLNEGGRTYWDGQRVTGIDLQCAEKQFLDIKLTALGKPGHSSVPDEQSSIVMLAQAIAKISRWQAPPELNPVTQSYLQAAIPQAPLMIQAALRGLESKEWQDSAKTIIEKAPSYGIYLHDTCAVTMVQAGYKSNVIPEEAQATMNCRLLPGHDASMFVETLKKIINNPAIKISFETPETLSPGPMPINSELVAAIRSVSGEFAGDAPVRPLMSSWSTDAYVLRSKGIKIYGFDLPMTDEDNDRTHGDDERISVEALNRYVELLYELTARFAGSSQN